MAGIQSGSLIKCPDCDTDGKARMTCDRTMPCPNGTCEKGLALRGTSLVECRVCHGQGYVECTDCGGSGILTFDDPCPTCQGRIYLSVAEFDSVIARRRRDADAKVAEEKVRQREASAKWTADAPKRELAEREAPAKRAASARKAEGDRQFTEREGKAFSVTCGMILLAAICAVTFVGYRIVTGVESWYAHSWFAQHRSQQYARPTAVSHAQGGQAAGPSRPRHRRRVKLTDIAVKRPVRRVFAAKPLPSHNGSIKASAWRAPALRRPSIRPAGSPAADAGSFDLHPDGGVPAAAPRGAAAAPDGITDLH